jgi:tetratricopeptide (TPR) repeat protein
VHPDGVRSFACHAVSGSGLRVISAPQNTARVARFHEALGCLKHQRGSILPALLLISLALCLAGTAPAQNHHHGPEGVSPEALEKLGTVQMPISCTPEVNTAFERGVAMLHSFWYEEARRQFSSVIATDPSCAMAQWGLAMTEWRPFWDGMPESRRQAGIAEIEQASELAPATDRERRYIAAISGYLHTEPAHNEAALNAYVSAMGALHAAYPDDVEAQAFYGLALAAAAAVDTKDPIGASRKALAVLEPGFEAHPDHPGFAHYIIHTCDNPQLAREGLPAAEHYAAIAPASAHALHMPGHIFARLGMWPEDISTNLASVQASKLAEREHLDGVAHEMHAYEFLLYAYLQQRDDVHARQIFELTNPTIAHLQTVPGIQNDGMFVYLGYFTVDLPSIYHLERHEWQDILALHRPGGVLKSAPYYLDWAQAIAAGHLRDAGAADRAAADAQAIYRDVSQESSPISAEEHATFLTIQGWQDYAHHRDHDALAKLSAAADEQDRVGQAEVDIPAREMYADMLLTEGHPEDALAQYKTDLQLSPNRYNGIAGAARAAVAAGHPEQARIFYDKLLELTKRGAGSSRPEIREARQFLQRSTPVGAY